jgi:WD40 repeat protein
VRKTPRQRDLVQACTLTEEKGWWIKLDRQRAEEQVKAVRRLRRRTLCLGLVLLVAVGAAITAGVFFVRERDARDVAVALEAEAQAQAARADAAERLARAWTLVAQGRTEFESRPLLGLRLALEGLALVPPGDADVQALVVESVWDLAKWGRILKLGDDVEGAYANPDGSVLILDHRHTSDELRRAADGSPVATVTGDVSGVSFSPDPNATYLLVDYADAPAELRRTADGSLVATRMAHRRPVVFSPDPGATYFVIDYADVPGELRRTVDGSLIATLAGEVDRVSFRPDPDAAYLVIDYAGTRAELRRTADGSPIAAFAGGVRRVTFGPDATYCVIDYAGAPGELRRTADGSLVATLAGRVGRAYPGPAATCFVIDYTDAPDELRRAADGSLVTLLPGEVDRVSFSPAPYLAYFVIDYADAPGELRRTADGSLVPLEEEIYWDHVTGMSFSPDPDATYLVIEQEEVATLFRTADGSFAGIGFSPVTFSPDGSLFLIDSLPEQVEAEAPPSRLRRTADGSLVAAFRFYVESLFYSPDRAGTYAVVDYGDEAGELLRTADGLLIATLAGEVDQAYFSPDAAGTCLVVDYDAMPGELRRTADGPLVAALTGEVDRVSFGPDPTIAYFVVDYSDGRSELWDWRTGSRLAALGLAKEGHVHDPRSRRLMVWHTDGRAYILDLDWLRAMGGDLAEISPEELERLACRGPLATGLFDDSALRPYLEGGPSQACR